MARNKQARSYHYLWPYLLLVAAMVGGLLWHESENVPGLGRTIVSGQAQVGGPFRLTDQTGKSVSERDFRGHYMLIYFGYSFCPDVCPTTLQVMAEAIGKLGDQARRVTPVFITIDPERDTPKVLKDYMAAFGPNFVGLTGSVDQIRDVERKYRVYARKKPLPSSNGKGGNYGMDHSSVLYLMGPDGQFVSYYDEAISPDNLAKELRGKI